VATRERIGLFGGSFDPIHTGHLILAQAAVNALALDRVLFIPTAVPPHKRREALTDFTTRVEMIERAIAGNRRFELSLVEAKRAVSYTYRTVLRFVREGYGRESIHLLIGSDSLEEIYEWRKPEMIFANATIVVMLRPGHERIPPLPPESALVRLAEGSNSISSSDVRDLVRDGKSIRYLVPDAVGRCIGRHALYRGNT
jgi:nicotinate-nucleotide adenylyltransferase